MELECIMDPVPELDLDPDPIENLIKMSKNQKRETNFPGNNTASNIFEKERFCTNFCWKIVLNIVWIRNRKLFHSRNRNRNNTYCTVPLGTGFGKFKSIK
jgi:hypothetical protein